MAQQGGRIEFQVGFKTDKSGIQDLKKSLQDIQKIKPTSFEGSKEDLQEIKNTANDVEKALSKAFNPNINSINLKTFDNELKATGRSINDIYTNFSKAGAQGQVAFSQMARSVLTTNQQLKETHSIINQMGTTMVNTIKWGVASSIMNTFSSSVQGAFKYVESLEKSLTNIRIVTGDSQEKMQQFAESANRAAQELGRSTMDYSKAALTFYQQGLGDEDVQARTEAVLKAQNITGAGSEMADYMTSVWNGYKVANEQAQLYVDKLAAVADRSASDMSQLAIGMSKVASTANTMGVDIDQLNAQLATVIATTRQAPEAVGTAFKTIYTRMNDIKSGSDEAEISLGNYSGKMAELGFNVLDATGHLRDTGQVMQEIGGRWQNLTRQQQIYLATTMGGQRQVNQLMALFDNWTTYSELLNTSLESEGTLAQKNSVYLESLGAKMEQLGAAGERVKASLIDSESFGNVIELLTAGTNLLGGFIQAIGGGGTALLGLGGIATQVFSGVISKEINNAIINFQNMKSNIQQGQIEIAKTQQFGESQGYSQGVINEMLDAKRQMQEFYSVMSVEQRNSYNAIVNQIGVTKQQLLLQQEKVNKAKEYEAALRAVAEDIQVTDFQGQKLIIAEDTDAITQYLNKIRKATSKETKLEFFDAMIQQVEELKFSLGELAESSDLKGLFTQLEELTQQRNDLRKLKTGDFEDQEELNRLIELENKVEDVDKALEATQLKIKDKTSKINNTVKELSDNHTEMSVHLNGVEEAQKKLDDLKKSAEQAQKQMSQALTVRGIVEGIGQIGRATSAIMALTNSVKGLFDNSVPPMQKFTKLMMSMGYSIPTLLTTYQRLTTLTQSLSAATVNATAIAQAKKAVDQAQMILDRKKASMNLLLEAQANGQTVSTTVLTAAKEAEKVATDNLTNAQLGLNAAMTANPIGLIITAIGVLVGVVTGAVTIYDAFTMSNKEADEALQNFNNKIDETNSKVKDYSSKIGNLSSAEEEWNSLSEKVGQFNSTINNLTEDEKQRYYELSNLIAQYNPLAVAGYDEQGNAIIRNNEALKETIELLKQKRQEEINSTYSGQDFDKAEEARQTKAKNINKERPEGEDIINSLEKTSIDISRYLNSYGDNLNEDLKNTNNRIQEIIAGGKDNILKNKEELVSIFSELATKEEDLPDIGVFLYDGYIDGLQKSVEEFNDKQQEVDKELEGVLSEQEKAVIGVLQTDLDGQSYYNDAQQAGMTAINTIALNYYKGMEKFNADGTLKSAQDLAKEIESSIIEPLFNFFEGDKKENSLYQKLVDSILNDQKLQTGDFKNLTQKNDYLITLIQQFIQENLDKIQALEAPAKEGLKNTLSQIFGIEDLNIDFDTGKIQGIVNSNLDTLLTRVNDLVEKRWSSAKPVSEDWLMNLLAPDIDEKGLDYITQHLDEQIEKTGDLAKAILNLQKQASKLGNLDENISTVELLNKQASGEKLGQKEQQALKKGVESLISSYPELQKQVDILNNQWLQGTTQYIEALRLVKSALIDSIGEGFQNKDFGIQELKNKVLSVVSTTEDLERISEEFPKQAELQQESLIKIASQYENCKVKLGEYVYALQHLNETQQAAAEFDLLRSTKASESAEKYGLQAERVSDLAAHYSELGRQYAETHDASLKAYEGLDQNAELAADAATRYIRLNDAIADMQKNYDSMTEILNAFATDSQNLEDVIADNSKAFDSLKDDIAGILDVTKQTINEDWTKWIGENAELIQQAMQGSQQAVDALKDKASQKITLDLDIDYDALESSAKAVSDWANNLPEGKLSVDDTEFLQNLVWAMQQAGYAKEEIQNRLSGMDINVNLSEMDQSLNEAISSAAQAGNSIAENLSYNAVEHSETSTSEDSKENIGFHEEVEAQPVTKINTVLESPGGYTLGGFMAPAIKEVPTTVYEYSRSIVEDPIESTALNENTTHALQVKPGSASKGSGGQISHKNRTGGNKKSSGGKGGKGKKGKGGKGKKGSTKTPKSQKPVTDKPDRYHDVNLKLKDIDNDLGELQKKQEKLTGKDLLDNLNKQLKLLEKQVATYKEKLELERQEANQIRSRLKKQGATFDPNGNISNYSKLLNDALKEYNEAIAKYNKMSAEEQQKNKDLLENAKLKYENLKKDIQRYDKIISEEIPGLEKSIQEAIDKQTEINIQKFKIKVDLEMDMSEAQREFNEFARKVKKQLRDDDILGNAKSYLKDYSSYYKGGYDVIQGLTDQIYNTLAEINNINKQGISSIYGTDKAAALKDLQEYTQALMSNLEDIEDVVASIKDSIFDAIDKAQDAFDEQKKEYEYIADLIEHNQKVVELLYGEDAYKQLQKYYELQEKNNKDQLDFLRQQKEMWYSRMEEERARMNNLTEGTNAWKEANDRFEEYKRHWMDAVDDINSQIEDSLDDLIDKYTNAVDKIFLVFENNITNGKGLDNIAEEWQLIGKQADQYLDKVNSMYEIDKLENAYRDAIDDNDGNIKAQQSLNNLMNEQLKYLKDKDKLTQYDVDRANALLQIEIKRLALEQARQNKTKLRLRRDAQGNYTYQYTADQDATRQAQQELADAQNSLYNLTKQAYKNNLDDYYDTTEEMNEKIRDVYKDTTLSAEEQNQKIAMIYEYYGDIINNLTQQNEDLKKFMMEDTFNEMAKMYNTNVQNFKNMTDEEKDILMNDMVPYWKSSIQDMADAFAGAGGFEPITQDLFNDLIDNSKDYQDSLNEIGKIAGVSLEDIKNATDVNIQRAETLLEKNDELINSYNEEMSKVQQVINEVERLVQTYQRAKDAAIQATEAAYEYTQRESANTANQLIDNKNTAGSSQYTKAAAFDTGGYTGDWGDVGKTAILHEKEIVLNAQDTINLLSAVKITRTLSDIISNFNMEPIGLGRVVNNTNNSSNSTSQNITIHADFPNVTEKSEIEAAFNNLVNKASQYAFRK